MNARPQALVERFLAQLRLAQTAEGPTQRVYAAFQEMPSREDDPQCDDECRVPGERTEPGYRDMAVLKKLLDEPHTFEFFGLLRRLDAMARIRPRMGSAVRLSEEAVRLEYQPTDSISAREVVGAELDDSAGEQVVRIKTQFFGLLGPNGALPLALTEHALAAEQLNDRAFTDFCNIFHHRYLALFYRGWAAAQPTVSRDRPEDDYFAAYVKALGGLALFDPNSVLGRAGLHFAGLFGRRLRNADGLQELLRLYFLEPSLSIEELSGDWVNIAFEHRACLEPDSEASKLGIGTFIGRVRWELQSLFRVHIGPLGMKRYKYFLPGEKNWSLLRELVRAYCNLHYDWQLILSLQPDAVTDEYCSLGGLGQLGSTFWLSAAHSADYQLRFRVAGDRLN
jgi:type VI secretion system protein ImpH